MNKRQVKITAILVGSMVFICALFHFLYQYDNKYQSGAPYGSKGVFTIPNDQQGLMFLIDDWEFYGGKQYTPQDFENQVSIKPQYLFIGQYPNFALADKKCSVFDQATYRMTIINQSDQNVYTMEIPEIFTDYKIWINQKLAADRPNQRVVSFEAGKRSEIVIQVQNRSHYYSGMTYPIVMGSTDQIDRMLLFRDLFYIVCWVFAASLFVFAFSVWKKGKDPIFHDFGWIALCFAVHCLYPFAVRMMPGVLWYRIEDASYMLMVYMMLRLCCQIAGKIKHPFFQRIVKPAALLMCGFVILIPLILPQMPQLISFYGWMIDGYRLLSSLLLLYYALEGIRRSSVGAYLLLAAGSVFAAGQLYNMIQNNLYEPIYGGWQTEYSALLMVLLFFFYIVARNRAVLVQNEQLRLHLEDTVKQRTAQLQKLVEERRRFFSDVAHDLKAPAASMHTYMELIQDHDVQVDEELQSYLEMIGSKNEEMQRRITSLNAITRYDQIDDQPVCIELPKWLKQLEEEYRPDMEACGIHFEVLHAVEDACIYGSPRKLQLLFENLLYNAMSFTPAEGCIYLQAQVNDAYVQFSIQDTGCGIAEAELSKIFERFYTKRENGSGLGLYIVKTIVQEMQGSIQVASKLNEGTVFTVKLPLFKNSKI